MYKRQGGRIRGERIAAGAVHQVLFGHIVDGILGPVVGNVDETGLGAVLYVTDGAVVSKILGIRCV